MANPQPSSSAERAGLRERRSRITLAALVIGVPLASGILYLFHHGPLRESPAARYVMHPVECVEVFMFCVAVGALGAKLWGYFAERRACRTEILPPWHGSAVPVSEATRLLAGLYQLPARLQDTLIVRRTGAILDFLCSRGSAADLDDHLRTLSDNDALALEGSYSLTRFITWGMPILGFLGTVLGITGAISGVTPEKLEGSLSTVTDGLALAFDTTALALGLTMVTMFFSFLVERGEQSVLDAVDRYADRELAHRFERAGAESAEFVEVVRRNTEVLVQTTEQLVQRQAAIWAEAFTEAERRHRAAEQQQQERLTAALEAALDRTLETHTKRLISLEMQVLDQSNGLIDRLAALATTVRDTGSEQQTALAAITQSLTAQVEALAALQGNEQQLLRLQETLQQNLTALAGAGSFEQAVHSLTAAIHLLTARAAGPGANRLGPPRSGAAA